MNPTIDLLTSHRSIRKFTDEPIDPALFQRLIEAGQAAASSSFLQGVTIIRVTDPDKRAALRAVANDQAYIEAAEFLVFCADLSPTMRCCERAARRPRLTEQFIVATVDTALYAGDLVVGRIRRAASARRASPTRQRPEILGLPQQVYPVFGLCQPSGAGPEVKPRLPVLSR